MNKTLLTVIAATALFGGLAAFGYLLYQDSRQHPRWGPQCSCEMVKNRECTRE